VWYITRQLSINHQPTLPFNYVEHVVLEHSCCGTSSHAQAVNGPKRLQDHCSHSTSKQKKSGRGPTCSTASTVPSGDDSTRT